MSATERPARATQKRPLSFALLSLLALACGGTDEPSPGNPPVPTACGPGPVQFSIHDQGNYTFSTSMSIERTTLKDATDLTFDWGGLTRDFFGKSMDPAVDIDLVLISLWNLTPDEIEQSLDHDMLERSASEGAIMTYPDGSYTSLNLLGFGLLGNPLPDETEIWKRFDTNNPDFEYPQDQHTFMIMGSTGTELGKGARMLSLFTIDPNASQTALALTNDSTTLDYTIDLGRIEPIAVPAAEPSLTIDWSQMTETALGNEYLPTQVTEAVVAHFPTDSLSELEARFLDLEGFADGWWSGPVTAGTSIDLGALLDENDATFPGVDADGTWVVALFCTKACNNPAPWSISILEPCE